jgi:hypothetical protein
MLKLARYMSKFWADELNYVQVSYFFGCDFISIYLKDSNSRFKNKYLILVLQIKNCIIQLNLVEYPFPNKTSSQKRLLSL